MRSTYVKSAMPQWKDTYPEYTDMNSMSFFFFSKKRRGWVNNGEGRRLESRGGGDYDQITLYKIIEGTVRLCLLIISEAVHMKSHQHNCSNMS